MKTYETVTQPAKTYEAVKEVTCDICGDTTETNWKKDPYDAVESTVELKTGYNLPEGGAGEKIEIDICPKCFQETLVPWVQSVGCGQPTVEEWDY